LRLTFFFLLIASLLLQNVEGEASPLAKDSVTSVDTSVTPTVSVFPSTDRRLEPGIFDMITNLPSDERDWALQTFKLSNWPVMALVTASTAVMIVYDNQMWVPFEKLYAANTTVHSLSDDFVFMGDGKFQFGVAGKIAG